MKTKFVKTMAFLFCVLFGIVFLTSCASVNYTSEVFEDGSRTLELSVVVSKNEAGSNLSIIKNEVTRVMTDYKTQFDEKVSLNLAAYSISITSDENALEWRQAIKLSFNSALDYVKAFAIYNGQDVSAKVKEYEDGLKADPVFTETFLYKKQDLGKQKNAFHGSISFIEQIETSFRLLGIEAADVDFSQIVIYPSEKVRSNAKTIIKQEGKSYHIFTFTRENLDETQLQFYALFPRTGNWYLMAVGITAAFAVVFFLVSFIILKNNKNSPKAVVKN